MSRLDERLKAMSLSIEQIGENARKLMESAEITDEHRQETIDNKWYRDRYVLIRPDGAEWDGVPGFRSFTQNRYSQRPAALRAAKHKPGCRVLDTKTNTIVEQESVGAGT